MSGESMTYETYLRQQVDKGCYGVAIISAEVALDIADFIEKQRERMAEADRKTENSSEKPNNCEDLQDWKDRMWAEAIVTEPTISKMEQVEQRSCDTCKGRDIEGWKNPCLGCTEFAFYEPKDEPQTERSEE